MNKKNILFSVVIPCKNEESNIARCLNSVIKNVSSFDGIEVIVVDSYSTDKTVEIAAKYPVNILQLKPDWLHCASAARYTGTRFASGEFIFFIDADMELEPGFLEKALDILNKDENIGAVAGIGKETYLKNNKVIGAKPDLYNRKNRTKNVDFLGGAALYRKKALIDSGGFNPFLRASEERELAQRIRKKNYSLISIPVPMTIHYTAPLDEWEEFMRKKNMNLFIGIGEALRLSHSLKHLIETLSYYKEFTLFLLCILFTSILMIFSVLSKTPVHLYLAFLPLSGIYISLIIAKKSLKNATISLIKWCTISIDIVHGILINPKDPKTYPTGFDIILGG